MEKINNLFDFEIQQTADAYPSIFSKDDVIKLLSTLRKEVTDEIVKLKPVASITEMDFQNFAEEVESRLNSSLNNGNIDVYDYSSAEFSIGYDNRLTVENIDFNADSVTDELHDILLDEFQRSFGKFLTNKED